MGETPQGGNSCFPHVPTHPQIWLSSCQVGLVDLPGQAPSSLPGTISCLAGPQESGRGPFSPESSTSHPFSISPLLSSPGLSSKRRQGPKEDFGQHQEPTPHLAASHPLLMTWHHLLLGRTHEATRSRPTSDRGGRGAGFMLVCRVEGMTLALGAPSPLRLGYSGGASCQVTPPRV